MCLTVRVNKASVRLGGSVVVLQPKLVACGLARIKIMFSRVIIVLLITRPLPTD